MKSKEFQPKVTFQQLKNNPSIAALLASTFLAGLFVGGFSNSPFPSSPRPPKIVKKYTTSPSHNPGDFLGFRTQCSGNPVPHEKVIPEIISFVYSNASPYSSFPAKESPESSRRKLIRGWGSRNRVFSDLIASVRPKVVIELGAFLGASALHMASVTRNLSLQSTVILCLDDFRGWPGFQDRFPTEVPASRQGDAMMLHQFMMNVVEAGESNRVMPMPFSTRSSLAALCELGVYGDLIEVDAGHDFHSAWSDINMAWAVLKPGGVLFGHDYFTAAENRGVRRAVNLFAKVKGLKILPNGEHWVLTPKPLG